MHPVIVNEYLIGNELFDGNLDPSMHFRYLAYSTHRDTVGIAHDPEHNQNSFTVYMTDEFGGIEHTKDFDSFSEALEYAKKLYKSLCSYYREMITAEEEVSANSRNTFLATSGKTASDHRVEKVERIKPLPKKKKQGTYVPSKTNSGGLKKAGCSAVALTSKPPRTAAARKAPHTQKSTVAAKNLPLVGQDSSTNHGSHRSALGRKTIRQSSKQTQNHPRTNTNKMKVEKKK